MGRRRQPSAALRSGLILVASLIAIVAIALFSVGPSLVAKRFNPVGSPSIQPLAASAQALHQSLTVADLHADSLPWGRDLAKRANYGHVDIPRLIQGNVALQMFTVVTKVPSPLLLEGNSDRTDSITQLAMLQRWPIPAWFSLKQRALHQAKQLQAVERRAANQFRIIQTRHDLDSYLAQRQQNQQITAGLLGLEGAQALSRWS